MKSFFICDGYLHANSMSCAAPVKNWLIAGKLLQCMSNTITYVHHYTVSSHWVVKIHARSVFTGRCLSGMKDQASCHWHSVWNSHTCRTDIKYYENSTVLSQVIAKALGDVFLRHSVYGVTFATSNVSVGIGMMSANPCIRKLKSFHCSFYCTECKKSAKNNHNCRTKKTGTFVTAQCNLMTMAQTHKTDWRTNLSLLIQILPYRTYCM